MRYPDGTVSVLLNTDQITDATRQALTQRLQAPARQPGFFSTAEFALLQAVCDRLIPPTERPERIDMAGGIDERLAQNKGNGWRYDSMPPDGDAYRMGLKGIDESAQTLLGQPFQNLSGEQQDRVLGAVQRKETTGAIWEPLPADRFFEELLAEAAELYYSHPLAQEEIGYVGMADATGWQRIGLNELEDREPKEI